MADNSKVRAKDEALSSESPTIHLESVDKRYAVRED